MEKWKDKIVQLLRSSEKYTETDMVYATKGSFWILAGRAAVFAIAFIKIIVLGRFLPQEEYGIYTFILSMVGILAIFSLPGINASLIRAIARKKEGTLKASAKERLKFSLIGSFASLSAAAWYFYNQNFLLATAFLVVALLLPFSHAFSIFPSFWRGRKDFRKSSGYEVFAALLVALVTIPTIILTDNPVLIIAALFGSQSLFYGIFLFKTYRQRRNDEILPQSINFGKSLSVMQAATLFVDNLDKIIIWKLFGPAFLAIYAFAQLPIEKIKAAIPIIPLALPKMGEKDIGEMKEGILKKFQKLFFISVPLTLFAILLAPLFYRIILPQYVDSVPYFQAFSLLLLFSPFLLLDAALVSEMRKKELYVVKIGAPLFRILLFLVLIPLFQIWGVIAAIIVSRLAEGIATFYFFRRL